MCIFPIFDAVVLRLLLTGPGHAKTCFMPYANNKGTDQPAHPCSPISTFVVCSLDSIISLDFRSEISSLELVSIAEQAGLKVTWSQTPEDTFPLDVAQQIRHQSCR